MIKRLLRWRCTRDSVAVMRVFLYQYIFVSHVLTSLNKERNSQYINRHGPMNTGNETDFLLSKLDHICEEISLILTILTDDKDEPLVLRHLR